MDNFNDQPEVLNSPYDFQPYFDNPPANAKIKELGTLHLPTGQIIASDPLAPMNPAPFTETIAGGDYPVAAVIINDPEGGDRYALARIKITNEPAVKWETAITTMDDWQPDNLFGYSVDSGLGGFMDKQTFIEFSRFELDFINNNPPGSNLYDHYFKDKLKQNAENGQDEGDWLNYILPDHKPDNIVMFHSGWGEGFYSSYWGIDAEGNICSLVTDFQVIESPETGN